MGCFIPELHNEAGTAPPPGFQGQKENQETLARSWPWLPAGFWVWKGKIQVVPAGMARAGSWFGRHTSWQQNRAVAPQGPGSGAGRHQHGSGGVPGGSQHAGDHHGEEVLIAEAHVAQQRRVLLAESLGGALQLHADVDEAVELDAGLGRPRGVAGQQQLAELGAEVVAQLGEGWEREGLGLNAPHPKKKKGDSPGSCTPIPTTLQDHRGRNQIKAQIPGMFLSH